MLVAEKHHFRKPPQLLTTTLERMSCSRDRLVLSGCLLSDWLQARPPLLKPGFKFPINRPHVDEHAACFSEHLLQATNEWQHMSQTKRH